MRYFLESVPVTTTASSPQYRVELIDAVRRTLIRLDSERIPTAEINGRQQTLMSQPSGAVPWILPRSRGGGSQSNGEAPVVVARSPGATDPDGSPVHAGDNNTAVEDENTISSALTKRVGGGPDRSSLRVLITNSTHSLLVTLPPIRASVEKEPLDVAVANTTNWSGVSNPHEIVSPISTRAEDRIAPGDNLRRQV
jgi:hypothetical protein